MANQTTYTEEQVQAMINEAHHHAKHHHFMQANVAGGKFMNKLKSRTFWLAFMAMAVSAVPLLKAEAEYIGPALLGYAAVIGAVAGLNAFNKQQERLIQMKSGNTLFTSDNRSSSDTVLVSGLTGGVTKV